MTLGSTQTWAQLHEQAFRRIGGSCRVVVLDNLAEGVLKPNIYDPSLNPLYLPCRVADPDRKGKSRPVPDTPRRRH